MAIVRMFLALVPPDDVVAHLDEFLAPRREAGTELRWTDPEQWHLTLAFLPEVPERALDPLVEEVGAAVSGRSGLALRVEGGGAFPTQYDARVLWAGVAAGDQALERLGRLARAVRQGASHAGAAPEGGRLRPHLTLARARRPFEATRWVRVLDAYAGPGWVADRVTVFESHLGQGRRGRPRHQVVATLPFGD